MGNNARIGKVVGGFERFVFEPEDVEAGFVPRDELIIIIGAPAAVGFLFGSGGFTLMSVLGVIALLEFIKIGPL